MPKATTGPVHIIGAGGLGRDLVACFRQSVKIVSFWDDKATVGSIISSILVAGSLNDFINQPQPLTFIIAVGNPSVRKKIWESLSGTHHIPALLIHPDVKIFQNDQVHIGPGSVIFPGTTITTDSTIGENTVVHVGCSIHHDTVIGAHCVIMPRVVMAGNVITGDEVYLSPGLSFGTGTRINNGERR